MEITAGWHTFISISLLFLSYLCGYIKAVKSERQKTFEEVFAVLRNMGMIKEFKIEFDNDEEEEEK